MASPLIEWYFKQDYPRRGRWDMPYLRRQPSDIDVDDLKLIRFSSVIRNETRDQDATVHFFEPDERFDEVWKNPDPYLAELGQYRQVMSPDFSLYADEPVAKQIFNTFRSRWCGWYWQEHGITVIPTVCWSTIRSFEFCFDGLPSNATLAVSTVGCRDSEPGFMAGYEHMHRRCDPAQVICYGEPFDAMLTMAPLIVVPYTRNTRIATRKP
ncbi:MAG: DUF4417 domain-containing protein [Micrococcales bacterium]|nr:DUF4417 domain-containing protein [Micrococcales bacterium]